LVGYRLSADGHRALGIALSVGIGLLLCYLISVTRKLNNQS